MVSFCTFWIFPAKAPGIGKRAIITAIPTNALQPRMLDKNQIHTTTCSGKYITKGIDFVNRGESGEWNGGEETTNRGARCPVPR